MTPPTAGGVKGRFTVASSDDIIVADNIHFVTSGQDVLGLVAKNNVYIAKYTPDPLTWSAGVIAQTGTWSARDWTAPLKSLMTFRGMSATADGGSFAGMFATRDYGYDDELPLASAAVVPRGRGRVHRALLPRAAFRHLASQAPPSFSWHWRPLPITHGEGSL